MRKETCMVCGKIFIAANSAQKTCSKACRDARRKAYQSERYKEQTKVKREIERRKGRHPSHLADTNERARAEGLTYGQYVAQRYLQNT